MLIGAVPPSLVKSASYPGVIPIDVFDGLRASLAANRADFLLDVPGPVLQLQSGRCDAERAGSAELVAPSDDGRRARAL